MPRVLDEQGGHVVAGSGRGRRHGVQGALMPPQGPAVASPPDPYDFSSDPVLQRVQAYGQRTIAEAEAEALSSRRQAALDYGDEAEARALGLSEADIAAARNNPFSVRVRQARAAVEQPRELSANLSRQNLGYSSAGAQQQSDLSRALLEDQSNAGRAFHEQLGGISGALLQARHGVEEQNMTAEEAAAQRAQDRLGDLPVGPPPGHHGGGQAQPHGHAQRRQRGHYARGGYRA